MTWCWAPQSCSVTLTLDSVVPSATYLGVSVILFQWAEVDLSHFDGHAVDPKHLWVHACLQRVKLEKIAVVSGKRNIKAKSLPLSETKQVAFVLDDEADVHPAPGARLELSLSFSASLAPATGPFTGLYCASIATSSSSSVGSSSANALFTHFEVHHAREAFPCPDDPRWRIASWTIQLFLPESFTLAVGNTALALVKPKTGPRQSKTQFVFESTSGTVSIPAYTICFAAFEDGAMQVDTVHVDSMHTGSGVANVGSIGLASSVNAEVPAIVVVRPTVSLFPMDLLLRYTREAIVRLQHFFGSSLPVESERLMMVVCPKMDLGGMEHHSCIFLNESLGGSRSVAGGGGGGGSKRSCTSMLTATAQEEDLARIVVHEVAHHWVGNAVGLPFAIKEGVCLLLEQFVGDAVLGKPQRKLAATTATHDTQCVDHVAPDHHEVEKGRELTGLTYQNAQRKMSTVVAALGWQHFQQKMHELVSQHWDTYVTAETFFSVVQAEAQ